MINGSKTLVNTLQKYAGLTSPTLITKKAFIMKHNKRNPAADKVELRPRYRYILEVGPRFPGSGEGDANPRLGEGGNHFCRQLIFVCRPTIDTNFSITCSPFV